MRRAAAGDGAAHRSAADEGTGRSPDDRRRILEGISAALAERGIPALLVRAPELGARMERHGGHDAHVLVRPGDGGSAAAALDGMDWSLAFGGVGSWRWVRCIGYYWDGGPSVHLHRGVSAAPLPPRALSRLERALWDGASAGPAGFLAPDPVWIAVFAATQAARPTPLRGLWLADVAACRSASPWDGVEKAAASVGVGPAVSWARRRVEEHPHGTRVPDGPLLAGPGGSAWSAAMWLRRRVRPWRLRAFVSGTSVGAGVPARARFAGVQLVAPPGVFVPQPVSEPLVEAAERSLPDGGLAVDVGTGCGAVALALARRRPDVEVLGLDLSRRAVRAARRNAKALGVARVRFHAGSLLDPLPGSLAGTVDVIVANLPYVPPGLWGLEHRDPTGTILGSGDDGLALQRMLARQALRFLRPGGRLLLQLMAAQWPSFAPELETLGYARDSELSGRAGDLLVAVSTPA
jgi:release factor glutamine methyltransferase